MSDWDIINASMGRSQDSNADVYGAAMGGVQTGGTPTPTPGPTPLPSDMVAMWDATALSGFSDGQSMPSWSDKIASIAATPTSDSGANRFTYVADSGGGLPAVRTTGNAVYVTSGTNAANSAMSDTAKRGIIVVARRFLGSGAGQSSANPCVVAFGPNGGNLLQANATLTGMNGAMLPCDDPGLRVLGYSGYTASDNGTSGLMSVNATSLASGNNVGGQISIGGWENVSTRQCCARADIIAILVFNRAVTAADFKRVRRHFCDRAGETYPAGNNTLVFGDSLSAGQNVGTDGHYGYIMAKAAGWAWGTWDSIGITGSTWATMQTRQVPLMGDIGAATGRPTITCGFEFANGRTTDLNNLSTTSQACIAAVLSANPGTKFLLGTSTDDGSGAGVATRSLRQTWNAYVTPANYPTVQAIVPLHLDPSIGVEGSAPTNGTANTYFQSDGLHMTLAGYTLIATGTYGFGSRVAALR